jgi:hypothetical protein
VDRLARTPTMHGAPARPRRTDTESVDAPRGNRPVEDNVYLEVESVRAPDAVLPAAGAPPPGGVSRSASGIARSRSVERRPSKRVDGLSLSVFGLVVVGGAITTASIWAVSRPGAAAAPSMVSSGASEPLPASAIAVAPSSVQIVAPVAQAALDGPVPGPSASLVVSARATQRGPVVPVSPTSSAPKPHAKRTVDLGELKSTL